MSFSFNNLIVTDSWFTRTEVGYYLTLKDFGNFVQCKDVKIEEVNNKTQLKPKYCWFAMVKYLFFLIFVLKCNSFLSVTVNSKYPSIRPIRIMPSVFLYYSK